jgi:PAB-dependent poly(A)-specific ribonuclease subunit 3
LLLLIVLSFGSVFHQADGAGYPVMDLGHVVTALNKLDAADEEKIVLASRDGKSMMVVSYADVARCLESAFLELCSASAPPSALQY